MKENFVFRLPPKNLFWWGEGKSWRISKRWGKSTSCDRKKSMQETGILKKFFSLLGSQVQCSIFDQVEPEPSLETVDRGLDLAYRERCDFVIPWEEVFKIVVKLLLDIW